MGFEKIENKAFKEADFEKAFEKAEKELREDAIKMTDFENFYGREELERDLAYVDRRETSFKERSLPEDERSQKHSLIFEAIFHTQAELSDWLGPDAMTFKASRYDDIVNGVDEIIEFNPPKEDPSHLALAIDVTYSNTVTEKLERIKREIEEGRLTGLKYFNPKEGGLDKTPRVVVGVDFQTLQELTDLWMERDNDALYCHPVQLLILDQIQLQLETFRKFALENGQENLAEAYKETLNKIKSITKTKIELRRELSWDKSGNPVFLAVSRSLQNIFKPKEPKNAQR